MIHSYLEGDTVIGVVAGGVAGLLALGLGYEQLSRRQDAKRPLPGRMVQMDGYRLHMTDSGQGSPAVLLLHGAGDCSASWTHVTGALAGFTRVITYDRPGMGLSEPGPAPSPTHTVQELHSLLAKSGIPGPYILVGHSLGGLIARLYASEHPDQVAGMVFVDSTHEFLKDDVKFKQGFAAVGAMLKVVRALSPTGLIRFMGNFLGAIPMFFDERRYYEKQLSPEAYQQWRGIIYRNFAGQGAAGEFAATAGLLETAFAKLKSIDARPQYGSLPIAVLTNPSFGKDWEAMHRELAGRSTNSIHRISDRKGHSLQMPRPELVIDAVRHVVDQVRERPGHTLADYVNN